MILFFDNSLLFCMKNTLYENLNLNLNELAIRNASLASIAKIQKKIKDKGKQREKDDVVNELPATIIPQKALDKMLPGDNRYVAAKNPIKYSGGSVFIADKKDTKFGKLEKLANAKKDINEKLVNIRKRKNITQNENEKSLLKGQIKALQDLEKKRNIEYLEKQNNPIYLDMKVKAIQRISEK